MRRNATGVNQMQKTITLPTELKQMIAKDRVAQALYRRLSDAAKQTYASYVIAGQTHKERMKRSRATMRALMGVAPLEPSIV